MFKWSSANSREYNSDGGSFSSDGSYHSILRNTKDKKKKKKLDRNVMWSTEFQTYEERNPHSFDSRDDYRVELEYNRSDTSFEDDESLIADYLSEPSAEGNKKNKSIVSSSVFTPVETRLENRLQLTDTLSEDDASLIDTMDDYYDYDISKAATDDASIVRLERNRNSKHQEVDGNLGHLGLVLPTFGGFLEALGVTQSEDSSAYDGSESAYGGNKASKSYRRSSTSDRSENDVHLMANTSKRSKAVADSDKRKQGNAEKGKEIRSTPKDKNATEKMVKKKKAKSTGELNVAIRQLETKSTESIESGTGVRPDVSMQSISDEVIEPLFSDEVSENGKQSGVAVKLESTKKKKKKASRFSVMNKCKSTDNNKSSKNSSQNNKQLPDLSEVEEDNFVEAVPAQHKITKEPKEGADAIAAVSAIAAAKKTAKVKQECTVRESISADGGSKAKEDKPLPDKKGKEKNKNKRSLKDKLSLRRKGSKNHFSKRELAFAYALQQQLAPVEDRVDQDEDSRKGSTPDTKRKETTPIKKKEPIGLQLQSMRLDKKVKAQKEKETAGQPETKRMETAPVKKDERSAPNVANKLKAPEEKVLVNQPETKRMESALVKKEMPSAPEVAKEVTAPGEKVIIDQQSFRDHLYNDILRGGSFDSVSTTSDILNELQQIEDAAQLMYQAMVKEGENDNSNTGMINMKNV